MSNNIRIERLVDAPVDLAFSTWMDAQARTQWYDHGAGGVTARTDLRIGGEWRVDFGPSADERYSEHGVITELDPPQRVAYTMVFTYPDGRTFETLTTVTFEERDGKTLLTLLDAGYPNAATRDGHAQGWPGFLDRYEHVLSARS